MTLQEFLEGRELGETKLTLVRYLSEVADEITFEPAPKGRSKIKCEFDCGAYKGSEVLTFSMQNITPMQVALALQSLTSGHHFSYPEADETLLKIMNKRVRKEKPNDQ